MSLPPIGATPPIRTPEAAEPAGRDVRNDHDADDGVAAAAPRQTPQKGQGGLVDRTA